jgi:hypothetical protein
MVWRPAARAASTIRARTWGTVPDSSDHFSALGGARRQRGHARAGVGKLEGRVNTACRLETEEQRYRTVRHTALALEAGEQVIDVAHRLDGLGLR